MASITNSKEFEVFYIFITDIQKLYRNLYGFFPVRGHRCIATGRHIFQEGTGNGCSNACSARGQQYVAVSARFSALTLCNSPDNPSLPVLTFWSCWGQAELRAWSARTYVFFKALQKRLCYRVGISRITRVFNENRTMYKMYRVSEIISVDKFRKLITVEKPQPFYIFTLILE